MSLSPADLTDLEREHGGPITLNPELLRRLGNPAWRATKGRRSWNEKHYAWELRVDANKARGRRCEIEGCNNPVEDVAAVCTRHRDLRRRHGHCEGTSLRRRWIAPWVAEAARYIQAVRSMPPDTSARHQLSLVTHWLTCWFARADGYDRVTFRPDQPLETRARRWIATAARHDATPASVLALVTGALAYDRGLGGYFLDVRHQNHQLAHLVLRPIPRRPEWQGGQPERLGYRLGQYVGAALVDNLSPFAAYAVDVLCGQKPMSGWPERPAGELTKAAITAAVHCPQYRRLDDADADQD